MPTPPLLTSAANFRDLGGYQAQCGRKVRHGLLYRSEALCELSDTDLETLRSLDIRLLCDVRSDGERLQAPNRWPVDAPVATLNLNISADLRASHATICKLLAGTPDAWHAEQAMLATYRMFPQAFVQSLPMLFEHMLGGKLPLLFHCAAGKDRTGFIAALILSALGVPRETIYFDYMLTTERWHGVRSEASTRRYLTPICDGEPSDEVIRTLCGVHPAYLDAAFEVIDELFGSRHRYLAASGLPEAAQERLKDLLLE
ncbi:Tyrosine-protein phosphatase [compost metagenome]